MLDQSAMTEFARAISRRTAIGKTMYYAFVGVAAAALGASRAVMAEACSGCSACSGQWCNCTYDCLSDGSCNTTYDILGNVSSCWSYPNCGYPTYGCWSISGTSKWCCDCDGCSQSPSPCTCRPVGYGC
jgi:hypothetical protein